MIVLQIANFLLTVFVAVGIVKLVKNGKIVIGDDKTHTDEDVKF